MITPWEEFKSEIRKEFHSRPLMAIIFWTSGLLYVAGYFFNNLQNTNKLFTTAWFYDSIFLTWTNLFVLPLFLLCLPWKRGQKNWSDLKIISLVHFAIAPGLWIAGYLVMRFIFKVLLNLDAFVTSILHWLGS